MSGARGQLSPASRRAAFTSSSDSHRLFVGFDESGLLSFASIRGPNLRFVRMNLSNFKITSEVAGLPSGVELSRR
jgi:hypothetical protein